MFAAYTPWSRGLRMFGEQHPCRRARQREPRRQNDAVAYCYELRCYVQERGAARPLTGRTGCVWRRRSPALDRIFRRSAVPPFRRSAVPPFRRSAVPPFRGRAGRNVPRYAWERSGAVPRRKQAMAWLLSCVVVVAAEQAPHGLGADFGAQLFGEGGGDLADGGAGAWAGGLEYLAEVGEVGPAAWFAAAGAASGGEDPCGGCGAAPAVGGAVASRLDLVRLGEVAVLAALPGVEGVFDVALEGVGLDLPERGELVDADQFVGLTLDPLRRRLGGPGRGEGVEISQGEDLLAVDTFGEGFGPAVGTPPGRGGVHGHGVGSQPEVFGGAGTVGGLAAADNPGVHGVLAPGVATAGAIHPRTGGGKAPATFQKPDPSGARAGPGNCTGRRPLTGTACGAGRDLVNDGHDRFGVPSSS